MHIANLSERMHEWTNTDGLPKCRYYHDRMRAWELGILIEAGADIDAAVDGWKRTPLTISCMSGWIKCCRVLIAAGANVNKKDMYGNTPLEIALRYKKRRCFKMLLENDALPHAFDHLEHMTVLSICARDGWYDGVVMLVEAMRLLDTLDTLEAYDSNGWTALMYSASGGATSYSCLAHLLEKGASTSHKDYRGKTALILAAQSGCVGAVAALLEHGARKDIVDRDGNSAEDIARYEGFHSCKAALSVA